MSADNRVHRVVVSQLDFYALTQWREHLGENDLLVPYRRITVFPHARFALQKRKKKPPQKFSRVPIFRDIPTACGSQISF